MDTGCNFGLVEWDKLLSVESIHDLIGNLLLLIHDNFEFRCKLLRDPSTDILGLIKRDIRRYQKLVWSGVGGPLVRIADACPDSQLPFAIVDGFCHPDGNPCSQFVNIRRLRFELDDDDRPLSYFGIGDGSEILVDEKENTTTGCSDVILRDIGCRTLH